MTPDIKSKLSAELSQPITTERQVVYILVQIRKLLDTREDEDPYPNESLRLYCNWVVHTSLGNMLDSRNTTTHEYLAEELAENKLRRYQEDSSNPEGRRSIFYVPDILKASR